MLFGVDFSLVSELLGFEEPKEPKPENPPNSWELAGGGLDGVWMNKGFD